LHQLRPTPAGCARGRRVMNPLLFVSFTLKDRESEILDSEL